MELTFHDEHGNAIGYCEDGAVIYSFTGVPLAYLEGDSVYAFDGTHLGWWERGWVSDHQGAWVFFTESAIGGPALPVKHARPSKGFKNPPPVPGPRSIKPVPARGGLGWSSRSGVQFFRRRG